MTNADGILGVQRALEPLRRQLLDHPVYAGIENAADLRTFMEHHVFAVWDFMTLLKALQTRLTCVQVPWRPQGDPRIRRMINEIVLAEESDIDHHGRPASHFEMYLHAMEDFGADTCPVKSFVRSLEMGTNLPEALAASSVPPSAAAFVETTWRIVASSEVHEVAAAFALGREDIIPDMFHAVVDKLGRQRGNPLKAYEYYLQRHMHLDADEHGPMALRMLEQLSGDDQTKWDQVLRTARGALEARKSLWDGIANERRPKMDLCLSRN